MMAAKKNLYHLYTAIRDFAETKSLALVNEYHSMLCFKKERFYGCFDTKEFQLYANLNQKEKVCFYWILVTVDNDKYYQFKDFPGVNIQTL